MAKCSIILHVLALGLGVLGCHSCWFPHELSNSQNVTSINDTKADCTVHGAKYQYVMFLKALKTSEHDLACADHWWLRDVAAIKLRDNAQHTFVMDVGCNKGYFSAAALNYLATGYGDQVHEFYKSHVARGIYAKPCGACGQCKHSRLRGPVRGQKTVDILCFEPSGVHVESLKKARDTLYGSPRPLVLEKANGSGWSDAKHPTALLPPVGSPLRTQVNFHVRQEAMSNHTGTGVFPANCTVSTCSVGSTTIPAYVNPNHTAKHVENVKLTTVDKEMGDLGWPFLDVLKIDAEGFDPAVLAGAYQSLLARRIGVVSFEYHHLWTRSGASLRQCVSYLEKLGYACFFDSAVLTRISGGCWLDFYETWRQSNVVCAIPGSKIEATMLRGSYMSGKNCGRGRFSKDDKRGCRNGKPSHHDAVLRKRLSRDASPLE